jgi:hypothetical protein
MKKFGLFAAVVLAAMLFGRPASADGGGDEVETGPATSAASVPVVTITISIHVFGEAKVVTRTGAGVGATQTPPVATISSSGK